MQTVYIVAATRSAIGRFGGALQQHQPADLAAPVMQAALEQAGIEGGALDFIIMGNVLRAGHGQLIPRQAAFKAGIPTHVDAMAIDMVCSSGMMALMNAATMIKAGEADLILAGGVESMTNAGFHVSSGARWGLKYLVGNGGNHFVDVLYRDGLSDPMSGEAMGDQTERLIADKGITRADLDFIAAMSQQRAEAATAAGAFDDEITPLDYRERRETRQLVADEGIRAGTTEASLGKLRPAFNPEGTLTAGNSSQISDGAAVLLVASQAAVDQWGLTPLAVVHGGSWAAGEPWRFAEAPLPAVRRLLDRTEHSLADFDLFENNEAFAVNSVLIHRELGVNYDQLNVHGGAIALGHPIGCSGARIVVTLLHALRRQNKQHGLASICHGTGGGTAVSLSLV